MISKKIDNLEVNKVTEDILLIHQKEASSLFTVCDGLFVLPKKGRNSKTIILDANIEPKHITAINKAYGPVSDYVCTHGHMDHITHVYAWEQLGVAIHAFNPEANYLTDLQNFYFGYGFNKTLDFTLIKKFAEINGYHECNDVNVYEPGSILKFEDLEIKTIPFQGHSLAHVGFLLPTEKILHISCLGFDQLKPRVDGFGPWYGFEQCSISQYLKDIDYAELLFLEHAEFLTSSHSYIVKNPDCYPFSYMRSKIKQNQQKVDQALKSISLTLKSENEIVENLLKKDIFFPKRKLNSFMLKIYTLWESWIIRKHIQRSKFFKF